MRKWQSIAALTVLFVLGMFLGAIVVSRAQADGPVKGPGCLCGQQVRWQIITVERPGTKVVMLLNTETGDSWYLGDDNHTWWKLGRN